MKTSLLLAFGFAALFFCPSASATRVEYTMDPARSSVTVLGAIRTDSFQPRTFGSSIISYQGIVFAELDGDELSITGVNARDTAGSFGEPGVPPAYDLVAETFAGNAFLSIISIAFSGSTAFDAEPFSISQGQFPGYLVRFFIGDGSMRFQAAGSAQAVPFDLHGRGSPNTTQRAGTITQAQGLETLTVPLDMAVLFSLSEENDTILTFSGEFVATRPVPEPSVALLAFAAAGFMVSSRPRSKRDSLTDTCDCPSNKMR